MSNPTPVFEQWAREHAPAPLLVVQVHFNVGDYEKTQTCEVPGIRNHPELLAKLNSDRFIALIMEGDDVPSYVNCAHITVVEHVASRI